MAMPRPREDAVISVLSTLSTKIPRRAIIAYYDSTSRLFIADLLDTAGGDSREIGPINGIRTASLDQLKRGIRERLIGELHAPVMFHISKADSAGGGWIAVHPVSWAPVIKNGECVWAEYASII